jgi:hypothetical protein
VTTKARLRQSAKFSWRHGYSAAFDPRQRATLDISIEIATVISKHRIAADMSKLIFRWLANAGTALQWPMDPGRDYVRPRRGDQARDLDRVVGDMAKIGGDLRKTATNELARHGK